MKRRSERVGGEVGAAAGEELRVRRYGQLVILADVAHIQRDAENALSGSYALLLVPLVCRRSEPRERPDEIRVIRRGNPQAGRGHEILGEIRREQTLRAENAGIWRYDELADTEARRNGPAMQRAATTESQQREPAGIVTALDRYGANGADHIGDDDVYRSERCMLDADAHGSGDRGEG